MSAQLPAHRAAFIPEAGLGMEDSRAYDFTTPEGALLFVMERHSEARAEERDDPTYGPVWREGRDLLESLRGQEHPSGVVRVEYGSWVLC